MNPGRAGNDGVVHRSRAARVLVADSTAAFAGVVAELLDDEPGFTVVAAATTAEAAVELVHEHEVDVTGG